MLSGEVSPERYWQGSKSQEVGRKGGEGVVEGGGGRKEGKST